MLFNLSRPVAEVENSHDLNRLKAGSSTDAGVSINPESAMRVTAVSACVKVISETLAQLPLILYERKANSKERAISHNLYSLLHDMPNDFQTSFDWRLTKTAHVLLHGAGYSYINRSGSGEILEILPMMPEKIEIKQRKNYVIDYIFTDMEGKKIPLKQSQVFRITGFSLNGVNGISAIENHKRSIGISYAADQHAALMFKNGAKMSGVLQNEKHFSSEDVAKRVKESWEESTSGQNANKTALLEDGLKWQQVSMNNKDAQYIESRKFSIEEIARIFRVQLHKIGHLEKSTNNNIEHQGLEFVTDTMMPWFRRWEQSIARDLIGRDLLKRYFSEFLVDGLLRGDSKSRSEFYAKAVGGPWMTINEARSAENRNPLPDGDKLITPLNVIKGTENEPNQ